MKLDAQVDMIELKDYDEIDLDETPVVALACGHFFTAQTLDGTYNFCEIGMTPCPYCCSSSFSSWFLDKL
jgi:hypothetical protein